MTVTITGLPEEKYRGQRIGLLANVPHWATRILFVGADKGRPGYLLRKRPGVEVYGIEPDEASVPVASELLDSVIPGRPESAELPYGSEFFGAIVILDPPDSTSLTTWLTLLRPYLKPDGRVLVLSVNEHYLRDVDGPVLTDIGLLGAASAAGLAEWNLLRAADPTFAVEAVPEQGVIEHLAVLTATDYDALAHAKRLRDDGRPDLAYAVLREAPTPEDAKKLLAMQSSMLDSLCEWGRRGEIEAADRLYAQAVNLFYEIVKENPAFASAYVNISHVWSLMGAPEMGARQLRSLQHREANDAAAARLKKLPAGRVNRDNRLPPEWQPSDSPPRVLFIMPPRPHFGLDVLYDGLVRVLGAENVVEFPPKPTLHGSVNPNFANYPCNFDLPDHQYSLERCVDELASGSFDLVLYGDCERALTRREARTLAEAAKKTPLFIVDQRDEFFNCEAETMQYAGIADHAGYFKREMLACLDYGDRAMPLPFGFPDGRIPEEVAGERPHFFFWAGHRRFSLRRLYLEQVEGILGETFDAQYTPSEYAERLRSSQVGLNCFGAGFDTVRYWELPAHGCLLLSERLPIEVPHDFRDGETALFFDDASELERKMNYIRRYPDLIGNLAAAGRAHFLEHHTGSARARQLLAWTDLMLKS